MGKPPSVPPGRTRAEAIGRYYLGLAGLAIGAWVDENVLPTCEVCGEVLEIIDEAL